MQKGRANGTAFLILLRYFFSFTAFSAAVSASRFCASVCIRFHKTIDFTWIFCVSIRQQGFHLSFA
jgi:hypothetical protein